LKSRKGPWGDFLDTDNDDEELFEPPLELEGAQGEGIVFLEEAHEALAKLQQKTNKRGRLMKQPKRAESWQ